MSQYQKRFAKLLVGSILYATIMFLSVPASGFISQGDLFIGTILLALAFIASAGTNLYKLLTSEKTKMLYIVTITNMVLYVTLAVFANIARYNNTFIVISGFLFSFLIVIDTIFSLIINHKGRNIAFSIIAFIFAFLIFIIFIMSSTTEYVELVFVIIPACLIVASFVHILVFIFSGLRRKTLMQVIKKTYTIEILYGLVTLIVATAVMLTFWEDNFPNIGDALWYCFAVVTTIGFGDFVATSIVGRLLTVMLGVYGIIVVALITSIIVNFYNETAHSKDEVIVKEVEKLEEERNSKKEDNKE